MAESAAVFYMRTGAGIALQAVGAAVALWVAWHLFADPGLYTEWLSRLVGMDLGRDLFPFAPVVTSAALGYLGIDQCVRAIVNALALVAVPSVMRAQREN